MAIPRQAAIAMDAGGAPADLTMAAAGTVARRVGWAGALLVVALLAVAMAAAWQLREGARRQALKTLQAQAAELAAHAGEVLSAAEFVLRGVADRAHGAADSAELRRRFAGREGHEWLRLREQSFRPVSLVSVFDDEARLVAISRQYPAPPIAIADREAFQVPRAGLTGTHVSAPARNRVDGRWNFFLSRRLSAPDGSFIGAAHIGLDCAEFSRFYEASARTLEGPPGGRIAVLVRSADHAVLARAPADDDWLHRRLPAQAPARWLVARAEVPDQPLFAEVQASEDAALEGWRRQARVSSAFVGLAVLLLAGGFTVLVRGLEQRDAALRETQRLRLRLAAEAANRLKTEFLANINHEVRTPLNGILGSAELLAGANLPPAAARHVLTLLQSGRRLKALLDDLLDFTRLEAGELQIHAAPFDPAAQLDELRAEFQPLAQAKGLALACAVDAAVPPLVQGDRDRVRQVLAQLLDNAIKFTRRGRVDLRLAADGAGLRWQVADSGIGVPRALQSQLFGAFVQADGSARRQADGTGLGLALAQRLVQRMAGAIGFDSQPGSGSTFWFTLPLPAAQAPAPAQAAPAARRGPPRVLLVEDDAVNAMVADAQLAQLGCTTAVAPDGESALRMLDAEPFDLVFMDCMLPGLSGYEVSERRRAAEAARRLPRVPIVALTANTLHSNAERCRQAGMDDFVTKPATPAQLQQVLQRWVH